MANQLDLEKSIFLRAIEEPGSKRAAFLSEACGGDADLRAAVEALLAAHDAPQPVLDAASRVAATTDQSSAERAGAMIGPYKLLEEIGEGGFGVVFMAEQQYPIRRKVALKVIKPGMDTRQVIARFEAERQALAIMDHPNIARVLDGGATGWGRPFFVMELIRGMPITDFCDQNQLNPRDRLELLVSVCQAVQHAHQKGIVHRDLKPSNVLVIVHDSGPMVKVIDFGVAKALGQELTEKTLFTGFAQMIGTPLYMSPEQVGQGGLDIDTRSDIYSLGVLLYELLTGVTPFDKERFQSAAYDEIRRIIREEEPPKPSTRLSSTDKLPGIAANRRLEPKKLSGLVRGDLDWIAMKCLDKDRNRRYETANGLAADLLRYLNNEPVQATPPSAWYRFGKFARRNRGKLVTVIVVSAAMIVGTAVSTWQAVRATEAQGLASARLAVAIKARKKEHLARQQAMANLRKAHEAVDRLLTRVGKEELSRTPHLQQVQRKLLEDALEFNEGFLAVTGNDRELRLASAVAKRRVGAINLQIGDYAAAESACRASLKSLRALAKELPNDPRPRVEMVELYNSLGFALDHTHPEGKEPEAIRRLAAEIIGKLMARHPDRRDFQTLGAMTYVFFGSILVNRGKLQEAEPVMRMAVELATKLGDTFVTGKSSHELARLLMESNRLDQAEDSFRAAIAAYQRLDNGRDWIVRMSLAESHQRLRDLLVKSGRIEEAEAEYVRALTIFTALGRDYPDLDLYPERMANIGEELAESMLSRGRTDEALRAYRRAVDAQIRLIGLLPRETRRHDELRRRFDRLDALLAQADRATERQQVADDIIAAYGELRAAYPGDATIECEFDRFQSQRSRSRSEHGSAREREQTAREEISAIEARAVEHPNSVDEIQQRAALRGSLARALTDQNKAGEALDVWRLAGEDYSQAIRNRPSDVKLWIARSQTYVAMREFDKALLDLSKAIELAPEDSDLAWRYLDRANVYAALGQPEHQLAELTAAISIRPDIVDTWVWRGWYLIGRGDWNSALADFSKSLAIDPNFWSSWHALGLCNAKLGHWDVALANQTRALDLNPGYGEAWCLRGEAHLSLSEWEKAIRDYGKAIELGVDRPDVWLAKAGAHQRLSQLELAMAEWAKLIEHHPDYVAAVVEQMKSASDEPSDALPRFVELCAAFADSHPTVPAYRDMLAQTHRELGVVQARTGQTAEAEQSHRQALAIWESLGAAIPSEPSYRAKVARGLTNDLTSILQSTGRSTEAEQTSRQAILVWEKLVAEYPGVSDYRGQLGETYGVLGKILVAADRAFEAERSCTEAIEKWPETPSLYAARARILIAARQPDKALPDFTKALEIGGSPWAYLERSEAYRALKKDDEALADLSRAIELFPTLWDAWVWRANFKRDHRQWDQAIADYSKTLELNPNYAPGWQARAFCYGGLGQWDRAMSDYDKAFKLSTSSANDLNSLAWLLATCPDARLRDPARAVEMALKAVALKGTSAPYWNTLGVAYFRAGDDQEAINALSKSNELLKGNQLSFNGFFLAMACWRLNRKEEARQWFDQAVAWMAANAIDNDELTRFRTEAEGLLGIENVRAPGP